MSTNTLLFTFSLLFIIQTNFSPCLSTPESPPPVRVLAGDVIRGGINYYILPAIIMGTNIGGGLTLSNDTCPPQVIQDNYEFTDGIPLIFSPFNAKKGVIRLSSDINIKFATTTNCSTSLVWRLHELDALTRQYYVSVGGVEGNPGPQPLGLSSWFKIERYKSAYKLRFCPSVCKNCRVICRDIGIVMENGKRRLALSDVPFEVVFKKA